MVVWVRCFLPNGAPVNSLFFASTARAPEAVFTVRTYGDADPPYGPHD
jgi:hypothetical protein